MKKLLFLSIIVLAVITSCENDDCLFKDPVIENYFLSIDANSDFTTLEDQEMNILKLALERIRFKSDENGIAHIASKSAKEVNISQNIYDWIKNSVENYNIELMSGTIYTRATYASNSESGGNEPSDCVAHAVSGALDYISYEYANSVLTSRYGSNGVPAGNIYEALTLFGPVRRVDSSSFQGGMVNRVVVIDGGHALTGVSVQGDYIVCWDYQKMALGDPNYISCLSMSMVHVYQFSNSFSF